MFSRVALSYLRKVLFIIYATESSTSKLLVDVKAVIGRAFALLVVVSILWSPARAATTMVAHTDAVVPVGFKSFGFAGQLNGNGQVAFWSRLNNGNEGIYFYNGSTIQTIAQQAPLAPDTRFFGSPRVNDSGHVLFNTDATTAAGGLGNNEQVLLYNGFNSIAVASENANVPDGTGQYASFCCMALNNADQVTFYSGVKNSGVSSDDGIYLYSSPSVTKIARVDTVPPDGNGKYQYLGGPAQNGSGAGAFWARIKNSIGGTTDDDRLYLYAGGGVTKLLQDGTPAPGGGTFDGGGYDLPGAMNDSGQLAFWSETKSAGGQSEEGIFFYNGQSIVSVARKNGAAPDGNGQFSYFGGNPLVSTNGKVSFVGFLNGTASGISESGIYLYDGVSGATKIARTGDAAPDGNGQFSSFFSYGAPITGGGQLVFQAQLQNTVSGAADNQGIYISDGTESLKVVRKGEVLPGAQAATSLTFAQQSSGDGIGINDFGQITYWAKFADTSEGLYLYTPELNWRSNTGGQWDTASNWTLSLRPGPPHNVTVNSASSIVVNGPSTTTSVRSLALGGGAGQTTLVLQSGSALSASDGISVLAQGVLSGGGSLHANVSNGGTIAVGTPSSDLAIDGNYTQASGGTLLFNLFGASSYGQISVGGDLTLAGTLRVQLNNGFVPHGTVTFDLLDWTGTRSGLFSAFDLPTLGGLLSWDTAQLYTNGTVSVTGPAPTGDINGDGHVDAADYVMWRHTAGSQQEYDAWRAHFGQSFGLGAGEVPEPRVLPMIVAAVAPIWFRRRRCGY
jgi:hypothetical protein